MSIKNINRLIVGALATIPMTIFMRECFKYLPRGQKYPLPPHVITMNVAEDLDIKDELSPKEKVGITYLSHFAYGAVAALLYFPLVKKLKINRESHGIAYGLLVWGISYLALLPSLELYKPIKKEPMKRTLLMVAAHVVWGASLGLMEKIFKNEKSLNFQDSVV